MAFCTLKFSSTKKKETEKQRGTVFLGLGLFSGFVFWFFSMNWNENVIKSPALLRRQMNRKCQDELVLYLSRCKRKDKKKQWEK